MSYWASGLSLALQLMKVLKLRPKSPTGAPTFEQLHIKEKNAIYLINMSPPGWPGVP